MSFGKMVGGRIGVINYEKQRANHVLSFFKFFNPVFNPVFILTPIVGKYRYWEFEGGNIEYQDIYVFGIRVIRWQL